MFVFYQFTIKYWFELSLYISYFKPFESVSKPYNAIQINFPNIVTVITYHFFFTVFNSSLYSDFKHCQSFLTLNIVILCLNHMVWPCVELFIKQDLKQNPADPNYLQISPRVTCLTSFKDFRQNSIVTLLNFKMYQL